MKKTFEVDQDFLMQAYDVACAEWKQKLKNKFPDAWPKSIMERIKTWEDVEAAYGKVILPYANPQNKQEKSVNAFVKIQYITKTLNEGWVPDFTNTSEYKWYPWFERKTSGWVLDHVYDCNDCAALGSDCFYKTEELARHAAAQFLYIYKDYLPE